MGLARENVYEWICALKTKLSNDSTKELTLPLGSGKEIALCAADESTANQVSLKLRQRYKDHEKLRQRYKDHEKPVLLAELGTCLIKESSEKDMQKNLHPLFSRLCIYAFLGVTHRDIIVDLDLKQEEKKKKKKSTEIEKETEELLRLDFKPETISKSSFGPAFNILIYAVCYSRLIKRDNGNKDQKDKLKKLASEMLITIRAKAAESLMKSLASKRSQILSKYQHFKMHDLTISYGPSLLTSGPINCYCTRLEMERKFCLGDADENLKFALNNQLLQCTLGLDSVVNITEHFIEVELTIGFLRCKSLQLDSVTLKERFIPAKIGITMWPESDFEFNRLYLNESSANPYVSVCTAKSSEIGLQGELGPGGISVCLECKNGRSSSYTKTMKNWHRERDDKGTQEWTLYAISTAQSVFDYEPCCTKTDEYRAFKALAEPFTKDGGVHFEGERGRGPPMTWRFNRRNINLEGKKLKWSVDVEVWLAYYGNKYMETRYKKFDGLSLVQPIKDSTPQPPPVQHPEQHPTEPQVPLKWVIVLFILFLVYNRFFN